jgi:hypothetical protein
MKLRISNALDSVTGITGRSKFLKGSTVNLSICSVCSGLCWALVSGSLVSIQYPHVFKYLTMPNCREHGDNGAIIDSAPFWCGNSTVVNSEMPVA